MAAHLHDANVMERALAAFLGFAVGDALGATVEFMSKAEIVARHGELKKIVGGGWLRLKPGQVTDDTELALALGRSLVRRAGFDTQDICEEFAAWLKAGPVDVGNTCRRGIRRYITQGTTSGAIFGRRRRQWRGDARAAHRACDAWPSRRGRSLDAHAMPHHASSSLVG